MNTNSRPVKTWRIALFALNDFVSVVFVSFIAFYMVYCQNILGLSAVIIGTLATTMRIWDAITDPIIGFIMDRTNTRIGRFRPFIILGIIIEVIALTAMFNAPASLDTTWMYIYQIVLHIIYIIGYTLQGTVTRSFQSILTDDPKKRPLFFTFNGIYIAIATIIVPMFITTILPARFEGGMLNPALWSTACMILCCVCVAATILTVVGMAERDKPQYYLNILQEKKARFSDYGRILKKNKPLRALIALVSLGKFNSAICTGSLTYLFSYVLLHSTMQGQFSILQACMGLIITLAGTVLARKYGGKQLFKVVLICGMIACAVSFVVGPDPNSPWTVSIIIGIQAAFLQMSSVIGIPMIGDCCDYYTSITGERSSGMTGTVVTLFDKTVSSLATTVIGVVLGIVGVANVQLVPNEHISDAFDTAIMVCISIVPFVLQAVMLLVLRLYDLTPEKMAEVRKTIANMNNTAENIQSV